MIVCYFLTIADILRVIFFATLLSQTLILVIKKLFSYT